MKKETKQEQDENVLEAEGDVIQKFEEYELPEFDKSKVDDMTLALLYLVVCDCGRGYVRAWKSFDWDAMERLYEQGMICDPVGKAKSVHMTPEGFKKAKELFKTFFATQKG